MRFHNREEAGDALAEILERFRKTSPYILGLPRGGVPVAARVAVHLGAPLDVWVARKLGAPLQPEFGFGAIAPDAEYIDEHTVRMLGLSKADLQAVVERERQELHRRVALYRGGRPEPRLAGRTVILVDDGLATGVTARAALLSVRKQKPRAVVFAAPVCAVDSARALRNYADEVVCGYQPDVFRAVGLWYEYFGQTTDDEVLAILREHGEPGNGAANGEFPRSEPRSEEVTIRSGTVSLAGDLVIPANARGLVVFAHGSGSSRKSSRNRFVAQMLHDRGLGTLLFDLLTPGEESVDRYTSEYRFDIDRLGRRMAGVVDWLRDQPGITGLPIGLFGASTGAAAALIAAAERPEEVSTVVSRGGRPDLAGDFLYKVRSPTLLIVGGDDDVVIGMNAGVMEKLPVEKKLSLVPGATHLFEEPGTLEQVAVEAAEWFLAHLGTTVPGTGESKRHSNVADRHGEDERGSHP